MPCPIQTERSSRPDPQRFPILTGAAAVLLGILVLIGWTLRIDALRSVVPGLVAMQPVTATCMVLTGTALLAAGAAERAGHAVTSLLAATVLAIAGQTLLEYATGRDFGTDTLLYPATVAAQPIPYPHLGRMSQATGLAFTLLATALLSANSRHAWAAGTRVGVASVGLVLALIPLLGYLYSVPALYGVFVFTAIAVHTATGLVLLFVGVLALHPPAGWVRLLVGPRTGAASARRLLPVFVIAPPTCGYLALQGQRAGFYGPDFRLALFTECNLVLLAVAVLWNAAKLNREHDALAAARAELERVNDELERRVEQRTGQLVQAMKMEAIGQLTAGIAHDFNNLLQAIAGAVAVLQRWRVHDDARRWFAIIERNVDRASHLTEHLLAFGRRQPLTPGPTDIAALLDRLLPLLEHTVGEPVEVMVSADQAIWPALVDPGQLERVIVSLALNARDAMPGGGLLHIGVENAVATDAVASDRPADLTPGDYVAVRVQDSGVGMDAATLARAFEPFFTTKDIGKGSGLGLSMVYGMAAQSGGGVQMTSRPGEGTTVAVFLPRAMPLPRTFGNESEAQPAIRQL